ncbi:MAG: hypothetical protein J6C82_01900 [Clostridia bacterium]|nr:hypothetical protein [Clostridia bacterium]
MKNIKSKKIILSLLTGAIMAGGVSVSAAWEFSGYDTTTPPAYGKIYNEKINGSYTSKTRVDAVAEEDVEWKSEGFEMDYPHAGYERLYLEGNAQSITRYNGQLPQWETRFKDFMWEVAGEHRIYQRQQTKIPNVGWRWDYANDAFGITDDLLFVPTTRNAVTTDSYKPYGVGAFDMDGNLVSDDVKALYNSRYIDLDRNLVSEGLIEGAYKYGPYTVTLDEYGNPTKEILDGTYFSDENLSMLDENGHYVVTDEELAVKVALIGSKYVTGPSFYGENPTKNVAQMYTDLIAEDKDPEAWFWDSDTVVHILADISWTAPQYEMEEPYNYYQYLVVNGLVFDGRNDLPRVYRFTDGKASPKVEWKYQWSEREYPYNVIEFKYVDGKQAFDLNGEPVYRVPTGEFGNIYFKTTNTEIQLWIKDARGGDVMVEAFSRVDGDFGGGLAGYAPASNYVIK